ncbi:hypothetical protein KI387_023590, partial [Taxus chinensis]
MVAMLEVGFFPMWQHVLYQWLCSGPDFDEVRKWFLRWKWHLPLELLANERIRSQLILGLEMMDQAVEGMTIKHPEVRETVSYLREKEQHRLGMKDNLTYLRVKEQCQFEALQNQQAVAEAAYDQKDASTSLGCMIRVNNSMGVPQLSLKEVIESLGTTVCFLPLLRRSVGVEVVSEHTTIEMIGTDGPGILSEVFVVLTDLGYNVVEAEVWTHNTRVACILYVTDKAT